MEITIKLKQIKKPETLGDLDINKLAEAYLKMFMELKDNYDNTLGAIRTHNYRIGRDKISLTN